MSSIQYEIPNISVDVVPIYLDVPNAKINVILGRRQYEPYNNEFALPGVLLTPAERLNEAAARALTRKAFIIHDDLSLLTDLGTFDNPDRDPRGATVSIAKVAVISHTFPPQNSNSVKVIPIDEASEASKHKLPFDHNNIIRHAAELVSEKLLHSKDFTRALLGESFTTSSIRGVFDQLATIIPQSDIQVDFSNLGRVLKNSGWVRQTEDTYSTGRGRPSRRWTWV